MKSISTGSSADLCNKIQINDRIVEVWTYRIQETIKFPSCLYFESLISTRIQVDFKPLQAVSNHQAVELLRGTGPVVHLKLERFLRGPRYEKLQKALKAQGVTPGPPSPSVTSLPRCPATMVCKCIQIYSNVSSKLIERVIETFAVRGVVRDRYRAGLESHRWLSPSHVSGDSSSRGCGDRHRCQREPGGQVRSFESNPG